MKPKAIKWHDYIETLQDDFSKVKRSKVLKALIRQRGIPPKYRGEMWPRITNSYKLFSGNPLVYSAIIKKRVEGYMKSGNESNSKIETRDGELCSLNPYNHQIELDLPRTFPDNIWFNTDKVQNSLRRVLHAYTWFKPDVGYCQAMNFLAAMMLFFIPEEIVFWLICTVMDDILPTGYYAKDLIGVRIDMLVFKHLFKLKLPKLAKHFETSMVEPHSFVIQWFLCLFITVLPHEIAMRFLDSFFYDGNKMLFRVALALFKLNEKSLQSTADSTDLLTLCRELPQTVTDVGLLMECAYEIKISTKKLDEYRKQARNNMKRH